METERRDQPETGSLIEQYQGLYFLAHEIIAHRPQSNCPNIHSFQ